MMAACGQTRLDTATNIFYHSNQPQPLPFQSSTEPAHLASQGIFRVPPSGVDARAGASNKIEQSEGIGYDWVILLDLHIVLLKV